MGDARAIDEWAASLRADARDLDAFLPALAAKLEDALPGQVEVERGGLLGRGRRIRALRVALGELRLDAERHGATMRWRRRRVVGGIALKTEDVGLEGWLEALAEELAESARESERGRLALERLLGAS